MRCIGLAEDLLEPKGHVGRQAARAGQDLVEGLPGHAQSLGGLGYGKPEWVED
jgi:hypothetical protein